MNRTARIKFWLNDKELKFLDKKAKKAGMSRSAYIRKLINESEVIPAPDIDYGYYRDEFRRIGIDLNEVMKRYNTFGTIDLGELDSILSEVGLTVNAFLSDMRMHTPMLKKR